MDINRIINSIDDIVFFIEQGHNIPNEQIAAVVDDLPFGKEIARDYINGTSDVVECNKHGVEQPFTHNLDALRARWFALRSS